MLEQILFSIGVLLTVPASILLAAAVIYFSRISEALDGAAQEQYDLPDYLKSFSLYQKLRVNQ